jgi:hypothetical protein
VRPNDLVLDDVCVVDGDAILYIIYDLLNCLDHHLALTLYSCKLCVCLCVCERERERERESSCTFCP